MDYAEFYRRLYRPLVERFGPEDENTIVSIVGFDLGGPLNFCTFGRDQGRKPVTYVSCELAVRREQKPNAFGRYELLASCNSEPWVRGILSDVGRMSMDVAFNDGDTMDIGGWVNEGRKSKPRLQGLLFKQECRAKIGQKRYGVLRCIGITRAEMEYAQHAGSDALIAKLTKAGTFPHTLTTRRSVV